ncbi:hypothetical protein [Ruania halotolerans]|uniref:hypothetical protein n=1 Tax=Ruania halotolerans TaxID=2897773 RepID=UPI001E2B737B|nr:hypothetical protein [Ruania halotolerans]UFU07388.1 hypothetical protein LQF10_04555 [Ruania halotolerans]
MRNRGPEAARLVADDPFWSTVRARHPDIDLVLVEDRGSLGVGAGSSDAAAEVAPPRRETSEEEFDRVVVDLWSALVPGTAPEAEHRWVGTPHERHRESTLTLAGTAIESTTLRAAADDLRDRRWRVLVPATGYPRVLADRAGTTLALVHVPKSLRTVLRVRTPAGAP